MSQTPSEPPVERTTLGQAVRVKVVHALLLSRAPSLVADEPSEDDQELYIELVEGVASEVAPLVGSVTEGPRWNLAKWAVALGTAARVEAALFPQQDGLDRTGLSRSLDEQYAEVLARLGGALPGDPVGGDVDSVPAPRGNFPPPLPYPDPAARRHAVRRPCW